MAEAIVDQAAGGGVGAGGGAGAGGGTEAAPAPVAPGATDPNGDKPITRAELKAMMAELGKPLASAVEKVRLDAKAEAVRQRYISEKMSDFPEIYKDRMPLTADAAALDKAHAEITAAVNKDWDHYLRNHPRSKEIMAILRPNMGGNVSSGGGVVTGAQKVDTSNLSPEQMIATGLKPHIAPDGRAAV